MNIFINIFYFYCLCLDFNPPPKKKKKKEMVVGIAQEIILQPINTPSQKKKMVVGIAQEIILQPIKSKYSCRSRIKTLKILKTWKSLQRQNSSQKAFIKHSLSINVSHKLHKFTRKTSDMNKEIVSFIKNFSYKNWS